MRRVSRPAGSGTNADSSDGDRVILSEAGQALARGVDNEAIELHLSPAELRAMIAPEEDRHVR